LYAARMTSSSTPTTYRALRDAVDAAELPEGARASATKLLEQREQRHGRLAARARVLRARTRLLQAVADQLASDAMPASPVFARSVWRAITREAERVMHAQNAMLNTHIPALDALDARILALTAHAPRVALKRPRD
jgi:hypothetical protein